MTDNKEFEFKGYWGADLLRPYVEYSKTGTRYCIYCGAIADTREHIPSKVFLNKPLPGDLPTLPACKNCNNSFSSDELYVNTYVECVKAICESKDIKSMEIRLSDRKEIREAKTAVKATFDNGFFDVDSRIERILYKLAIGHIVFELFDCYNIDYYSVADVIIKYVFKCSLSEREWRMLETIELLDKEVLPEIGSRSFRNLFVLDTKLQSIQDDNNTVLHHFFMDWTDIQDGIYRYIAYYNNGEIIVKMIIRDYLYGEIRILKK